MNKIETHFELQIDERIFGKRRRVHEINVLAEQMNSIGLEQIIICK